MQGWLLWPPLCCLWPSSCQACAHVHDKSCHQPATAGLSWLADLLCDPAAMHLPLTPVPFSTSFTALDWHPTHPVWYTLSRTALQPLHPLALQVFDSKDWDLLLLRSIVPKLAWALQDALDINPLQQDLDPFNWVLAWHPVMPAHHMVNLLEFRFFPKWHQVSECMLQLAVQQTSAAFLQVNYHQTHRL